MSVTRDFIVTGSGSLYQLWPNTDAARTWVSEHIQTDAMTLGASVCVEHRFIADIVEGIVADGLTVE